MDTSRQDMGGATISNVQNATTDSDVPSWSQVKQQEKLIE